MTSMSRDDVDNLVEAVFGGDENAFHALIEASESVLPLLVDRFQIEQDGVSRAKIVEIIWQHRQSASIGFLSMALEDSCPEVWKQTLDGIVTIGGPEGRSSLIKFVESNAQDERVPWVEEALQQLATT